MSDARAPAPGARLPPGGPSGLLISPWQMWELMVRATHAWMDQRAASKSAALAFYTLFSLAPTLILVVALAGAIFGQEAAEGEIIAQLAGLKDSLDELWDVPPTEGSTILEILHARLLSFSLVLVLGFLLLVSLAVSAGLSLLTRYWRDVFPVLEGALGVVPTVASFIVIAALFAVIYKMLPSVRIPWRAAFPGALLSATLFMIGKHLIGLYVGNVGVTSSFGAAGALVALLIWVYYSAQILFFGAAVTRELVRAEVNAGI